MVVWLRLRWWGDTLDLRLFMSMLSGVGSAAAAMVTVVRQKPCWCGAEWSLRVVVYVVLCGCV